MKTVPHEIIRILSLIILFLWKNINGLCFEGKGYQANEILLKAKDEAKMWFMAQ